MGGKKRGVGKQNMEKRIADLEKKNEDLRAYVVDNVEYMQKKIDLQTEVLKISESRLNKIDIAFLRYLEYNSRVGYASLKNAEKCLNYTRDDIDNIPPDK